MKEALCLIPGWRPHTPLPDQKDCQETSKETLEKSPMGWVKEQWAFLSGRSAGFSAKFDLELGCSCQFLGLETDRGENSALLRNRSQK